MKIRNESLGHFVNFIKEGRRFAQVGYSDAEWYSILGERAGERTALGQVLDPGHGKLLSAVLHRRHDNENFMFAVPRVLWTLPGFAEGQIDWWLGSKMLKVEAYERDLITDTPAEEARLYPFVKALEARRIILVGPEPLKVVCNFLPVVHRVVIETPNLHMAAGGIDRAVEDYLGFANGRGLCGEPLVGLVSAGVSAAVIVDRLYDWCPGHTFYDCGSMWDAFAGIGGQREWRAKLYRDKAKLEEWKRANLTGRRR